MLFLQGVANAHNLCRACTTHQHAECVRGFVWNRWRFLKKGCLGDQTGPLQTCLPPALPSTPLPSPPSLFKGASLMHPKVFQERHFPAGRAGGRPGGYSSVVFSVMSRICAAAWLPPSTSKEKRHFSVFEGDKVGRREGGAREAEIMNAPRSTGTISVDALCVRSCLPVRLLPSEAAQRQLPENLAVNWWLSLFFHTPACRMTSH